MKKSIENEKEFLKQYGKVIDYSQLQENEIREQPIQGLRYRLMYLIKESEIRNFTNDINKYGTIRFTYPTKYGISEIDFKKKYINYLEIALCVRRHHFIPDKILKDDILFFFNFKKYENNIFLNPFLDSSHNFLLSPHSHVDPLYS